jgi:sugar lactone lactonase YvrE
MNSELIFKTDAILGEGSLWDDDEKRLLWVDILNGEIHSFDPTAGRDTLLFQADQPVGTVVRRGRGGLAVAAKRGFAFVDERAGRLEFICDPEADKPGNRFNDGKCDPAGRFWAGTLGRDGGLYRLDADLTCRKMLGGVTVSNGIVWSPDAGTMYYTDTATRVIWAFDYDNDTGEISNRRTAVEIAPGEGGPDGFTVDAEGMLWVAQWNGWQVARYDPATGKKLEKIDVPAAEVSSCAFGGANLDELYITTAREHLTPEELAAQPLAGSLFAARPGVTGLPANQFKG